MTGERAGGQPANVGVPSALHFAIGNDAAQLASLRADVRRHLEAHAVDERAVYAVDLTLEELGGNVVRYGHARGAVGELVVDVTATASVIRVRLEDDGRPFDPTAHPAPDPARSLRDSAIGGRGIAMVRMSALGMRYERVAGRNRVEVELARETPGR